MEEAKKCTLTLTLTEESIIVKKDFEGGMSNLELLAIMEIVKINTINEIGNKTSE